MQIKSTVYYLSQRYSPNIRTDRAPVVYYSNMNAVYHSCTTALIMLILILNRVYPKRRVQVLFCAVNVFALLFLLIRTFSVLSLQLKKLTCRTDRRARKFTDCSLRQSTRRVIVFWCPYMVINVSVKYNSVVFSPILAGDWKATALKAEV